jgi:hypothetical protein
MIGPAQVSRITQGITWHKAQYGWRQYMLTIQQNVNAPQGVNLRQSIAGIRLMFTPTNLDPNALLDGYWDFWGDFTNYILNNVCQSTSCN